MKPITGGTYFSGGDLVAEGMRAAGITPLFGVEIDDAKAEVARVNGHNVLTADVCEINPEDLPRVDVFHASPECKNASTAKTDGKESPEDMQSALALCKYIEHHLPRVVTLENVWGYRKFDAFAAILKTLTRCGYRWDYWHLCAADYGVPQTRKRLILIASTEFQPTKPLETHTEKPIPMFETLLPWVGWYEAIADLIPTLPASKFADWQLERLPLKIMTFLSDSLNYSSSSPNREQTKPAMTVIAHSPQHPAPLGFIMGNQESDDGRGGTYLTVTALAGNQPKGFIVSATEQRIDTARPSDVPMRTLKGTGERLPRAFLMQVQGEGGDGIRSPDEPMQSVTAAHGANKYRAFLVGDQHSHGGDKAMVRDGDEPAFVADTRPAAKTRAWLDCGKVVKMTPRALARFQSIRDSYILPARTALACEIIGNAVPPLLAEKIYRHILASLD